MINIINYFYISLLVITGIVLCLAGVSMIALIIFGKMNFRKKITIPATSGVFVFSFTLILIKLTIEPEDYYSNVFVGYVAYFAACCAGGIAMILAVFFLGLRRNGE